MKYILTVIALAAIIFALPNRSNAQVYIDISGGASLLNDWEATSTEGGEEYNDTFKFDTGYAIYFEVGKKTDNRTLGLLLGATRNEVSELDLEDLGTFTDVDLDWFNYPVLGTFSLSTQITDNLSFNAGIAAGVNLAVAASGVGSANDYNDIEIEGVDIGFILQAKAGLDLLLTDKVSLGLDYRFSANTAPEFETGLGDTIEGDDMLYGHFIGLGLNIAF